jgi:hypothetical protein
LEVEVNYFPMKTDKLVKKVFHYDLTFDPPGPRRFVAKSLEEFRLKFFKNAVFAFDGKKNVYTIAKLNKDVLEETVEITTEGNDKKKYKIKIQLAGDVDMEILRE